MTGYSLEYKLQALGNLIPRIKQAKKLLTQLQKQVRSLDKPVQMRFKTNADQAIKQIQRVRAEAKRGIGTIAGGRFAPMAGVPQRGGVLGAQPRVGAPVARKRAAPKMASGGGVGSMMTFLASGLGLTRGISGALDLDKAVTDLQKIANVEGQGLKNLVDLAVRLESETGVATASIIRMMTESSKSGIKNEDLEEYVKLVTKIGIAFDMSSDQVATSVVNLKSSFFSGQEFGAQMKGLEELAGMISYIADRSASSEPYIVNFMQRGAALEKVMGASKESIAAFGASFQAIGIRAETAARAANAAQVRISSVLGDKKLLKALKTDAKTLKKMIEDDVIGTMFYMIQQTEGMTKTKRVGVLSEIFGLGFADELVRVGDAVKIYQDNMKLANDKINQSAALNEVYLIQMAAMNKAWDRMTNGLITVLAMGLTPALKTMTKASVPIIQFLKSHPLVAKMAGTAALLAISFAALGFVFVGLKAAALTLSKGIKKLSHAMLTNPAVIIAGAIALLGFVLYKAYQESSALRGAFESLGNTVSSTLSFGLDSGTESANNFKNALKGIGAFAATLVTALDILIKSLQAVVGITMELGGGQIKAFNLLRQGEFKAAWGAMKGGVLNSKDILADTGSGIIKSAGNLKTNITNDFAAPKDNVRKLQGKPLTVDSTALNGAANKQSQAADQLRVAAEMLLKSTQMRPQQSNLALGGQSR